MFIQEKCFSPQTRGALRVSFDTVLKKRLPTVNGSGGLVLFHDMCLRILASVIALRVYTTVSGRVGEERLLRALVIVSATGVVLRLLKR